MSEHLRGQSITLEKVLAAADPATRKSKVVCTIGPACWTTEKLKAMVQKGMNVARLNFSHGDHEVHGQTIATIREALADLPGTHVAIMLDTKGPEIRTGFFKDGVKKIQLEAGQTLELTTDYSFLGDSSKIACSYQSLCTSVKPGQTILASDGLLVLTVLEVLETSVKCRVESAAELGERKNMNLPGVIVDLPTVTEKDEADIIFGVQQRVDMIAASFVRKGSDVTTIRELLGMPGRHIKIIAKIENQEGLQNYDDILREADGIMVARGDLGMEIPPEKVFLAQKMMIRKANLAGKPVITATQMLDSMIANPRPTRAECTDVANAILDGSDCVMLSGETANGDHPLKAVEMMARICVEAESVINYHNLFMAIRGSVMKELPTLCMQEAIASSAVKTAIDIHAPLIVVCSETGTSARLIAKYRPAQRLLVLTTTQETARIVTGLYKGARALVVGSMIGSDTIIARAGEVAKEWGWAKAGDALVAVHGMLEGRPGSTNLVKVLSVP